MICDIQQKFAFISLPSILFDYGVNVLNLEQHVEPDEKHFFMRIHSDLKNRFLFFRQVNNRY